MHVESERTRDECMKPYQSSLAIPKSLQHRIRALLLHPSAAVGIPDGSKYSFSPLAMATSLRGKLISQRDVVHVKKPTVPGKRVHTLY